MKGSQSFLSPLFYSSLNLNTISLVPAWISLYLIRNSCFDEMKLKIMRFSYISYTQKSKLMAFNIYSIIPSN
jgi:hypothetical protein